MILVDFDNGMSLFFAQTLENEHHLSIRLRGMSRREKQNGKNIVMHREGIYSDLQSMKWSIDRKSDTDIKQIKPKVTKRLPRCQAEGNVMLLFG